MIFGSVCSGIEAASVAWEPLGWRAAWFSEINPFASAVLAHHYPNTPNLGDMTKYQDWPDGAIDLLCGGTPCQSFSVAGLRKGLDDPRGNLMLTFGAVAAKYRPRWLVWENVPGVLSSNGGRDFGAFLGLLGILGYGFAYRVLDAQYFGLAQRRKRVFVVGYLGDWRRAAAVLFERHSMQRYPAPSREAGQMLATYTATSAHASVAACLTMGAGRRYGAESETLVPVAFPSRMSNQHVAARQQTLACTLEAKNPTAIAFDAAQITSAANRSRVEPGAPSSTLSAASRMHVAHTTKLHNTASNQAGKLYEEYTVGLDRNSPPPALLTATQVRRLTPRECERLQGFPDDYTQIAYRGKPADQCPDSPRYQAIGNSWAVPVVRWIGGRIALVDGLLMHRICPKQGPLTGESESLPGHHVKA